MWVSEYRAICLMDSLYRVSQATFHRRNVEVTEYSLVATKDIPVGTFIGYYTGDFSQSVRLSMYAAKLNHMHIYPFVNEEAITFRERESRPLANMNEPSAGNRANCCMLIQDFRHNEIEFASESEADELKKARFFRGLACFTCADVKSGEELTWYYGSSYESIRRVQGYKAGTPCQKLIENEAFILENSETVLRVMPRVQYACVIPIYGANKSSRFELSPKPPKRKRKLGSESESSGSSSGSDHIPKYDPTKSNRTDRLSVRQRRRT